MFPFICKNGTTFVYSIPYSVALNNKKKFGPNVFQLLQCLLLTAKTPPNVRELTHEFLLVSVVLLASLLSLLFRFNNNKLFSTIYFFSLESYLLGDHK